VVVVGFIFVMVVLALLAMVTSTLGSIFIRFDAKVAAKSAALAKAVVPAPPQGVVSSAVSDESELDEDPVLYAVVAAAVHTVIGDRAHRIVTIRPGGPGWAQEGRRAIFSSHRVR
jgi:Na+-transporting methylmalonyl-CoA/oxaloacetate decarboxylase gamma subunit